MAKFSYGVGSNLKKDDGSESIVDIPANRTLYVQKLTNDDHFNSQVIHDLKSTEEVFEHFKPECNVTFETKNNGFINENLKFNSLEDFQLEKIQRNSVLLTQLDIEIQKYHVIAREVKFNKKLQTIIADPGKKQDLINALLSVVKELDDAK